MGIQSVVTSEKLYLHERDSLQSRFSEELHGRRLLLYNACILIQRGGGEDGCWGGGEAGCVESTLLSVSWSDTENNGERNRLYIHTIIMQCSPQARPLQHSDFTVGLVLMSSIITDVVTNSTQTTPTHYALIFFWPGENPVFCFVRELAAIVRFSKGWIIELSSWLPCFIVHESDKSIPKEPAPVT